MTSLIPVTIEIEEAVHQAVRLRAVKDGSSTAAVVNTLLRKALAAEMEEVAGLPPLAAMIQNHHDREQEALRFQNKPANPSP